MKDEPFELYWTARPETKRMLDELAPTESMMEPYRVKDWGIILYIFVGVTVGMIFGHILIQAYDTFI